MSATAEQPTTLGRALVDWLRAEGRHAEAVQAARAANLITDTELEPALDTGTDVLELIR